MHGETGGLTTVGGGVAHGGLNGLAGDGTHGGGDTGWGVVVAHGGDVATGLHGGGEIGGLIGVCTEHGGLLMSDPGEGLHVNVGAPHGGLTFVGGETGQLELGLQRRRTAISRSPLRTTTFGCCEYESE